MTVAELIPKLHAGTYQFKALCDESKPFDQAEVDLHTLRGIVVSKGMHFYASFIFD